MSTLRLTRRHALWMAATGAALASSNLARAAGPVPDAHPPSKDQTPQPDWRLIAPLQVGSALGAWTVVGMTAVRAGAVTVVLANQQGDSYPVDICLRDDGSDAPAPPARTALYDIFVANEGSGSTPTHEDHGLAAMAVAEVVRANEHGARIDGLSTQRQRMTRHRDKIMRGI